MKEEYRVYVLYSEGLKQTYTGHTGSLDRRLFRHNNGLEKSTKHGAPWILIYEEPFSTRTEAIKKEKELKTGKGRDFLKSFRPGSPPRRTKD
ncbi:endonuclease [Candidatus Peregrinibacteria bacterium CG_4_10_14_0_2_um_filter_43_11]|nr:MAG: endonuclease [Candidatus Peregrinibacteria bacterium CG_4_10_14_0_2_um_filter_43_11]